MGSGAEGSERRSETTFAFPEKKNSASERESRKWVGGYPSPPLTDRLLTDLPFLREKEVRGKGGKKFVCFSVGGRGTFSYAQSKEGAGGETHFLFFEEWGSVCVRLFAPNSNSNLET